MLALLVPSPTSSRASRSATRQLAPGEFAGDRGPDDAGADDDDVVRRVSRSRRSLVAIGGRRRGLRQRRTEFGGAVGVPDRLVGRRRRPAARPRRAVPCRGRRLRSAERRRAERGGVRRRVDVDGHLQRGRRRPASAPRPGQTAVDAQPRSAAAPSVGRHAGHQLGHLGGDALQHGAAPGGRDRVDSVMPGEASRSRRIATTARRARRARARTARRRCRPPRRASRSSAPEISPSRGSQRTADAAVYTWPSTQ